MQMDDYDAVHALWAGTAGMGLRALDDSRTGIGRFLRRNPATCFVALTEGEIVGVILCGHDGRRGHIYHAAVEPGRRRQGIGRALLERALMALQDEGIHKAALVVFADNETGNAFWQNEGFTARPDLVYRNRSINHGND